VIELATWRQLHFDFVIDAPALKMNAQHIPVFPKSPSKSGLGLQAHRLAVDIDNGVEVL